MGIVQLLAVTEFRAQGIRVPSLLRSLSLASTCLGLLSQLLVYRGLDLHLARLRMAQFPTAHGDMTL